MSLQELLNTSITSKPWMNIYAESISTIDLTVNGHLTVAGPITFTGLLSAPGGITGATASFTTLSLLSTGATTTSALSYYEVLTPLTLTFTDNGSAITGSTFTLKLTRIGNIVTGSLSSSALFADTNGTPHNIIKTATGTIPSRFTPATNYTVLIQTNNVTSFYVGSLSILTTGDIWVNTDVLETSAWSATGNNFMQATNISLTSAIIFSYPVV